MKNVIHPFLVFSSFVGMKKRLEIKDGKLKHSNPKTVVDDTFVHPLRFEIIDGDLVGDEGQWSEKRSKNI